MAESLQQISITVTNTAPYFTGLLPIFDAPYNSSSIYYIN